MGLVAVRDVLPGVATLRNATGVFRAARRDGALWFAGQFLLYWVYSYSALAIVGATLGARDSGGYRSAQMLFGFVPVLALGFENFALGRFADRWKRDGASGIRAELAATGSLLAGAVIAATIVAGVAGRFVLRDGLGAAYAPFAVLVPVLALQYAFVGVSTPFIVMLKASGNARWTFAARAASTATLFAGLAVALRSHGILGAAWSAVAAEAVSLAVVAVAAGRVTRRPTRRALVPEVTR